MSKDFSPQMHWFSYLRFPDMYTSNITWTINGKSFPMYSDEELADRKNHIAVQVLAADIYKKIRDILSNEKFETLNETLQKLAETDAAGSDTSAFPKEMTDWYFNRHDHYCREPNDEGFLSYLKSSYAKD